MDQEVGFVHPDDGEIYSGPSRWYHIDTACKHVTRSQGCHITERVKSTCRERDRTRYRWYQWSDLGQVKYRETKGIGYDVFGSRDHKIHRRICRSHYGSPDPAVDYWSERCLDHVYIIHEP